jgi:O-antigen/teichoic acid export membrane protein
MYNSRTLAANVSWLQVASLASSGSSAVLGVMVARYLGSYQFGIYSTAVIVASLFSVAVDMGFSELMVREAARSGSQLKSYLGSALVAFAGLFVCAYVGMIGYAAWVGYSRELLLLICVYGLGAFLTRGVVVFQGVFRVKQRLDIPAKIELGGTLVRAVLIGGFLYGRLGLLHLVSIHAFVTVVVFCASAFIGSSGNVPTLNLERIIPRAHAAFPFGLSNALYFGYAQLGTFLLSALVVPSKVGAYYAAFRIIVLANEFPIIVFNKALLPLMFRSYKNDVGELKRVYAMSARYMCGIGVLFSCGLCVYASAIMRAVYGRGYEDGIVVLRILALGIGARYLSVGVEATLTAIDRLKEKLVVQGLVVVCFLGLNAVLIPRYSLMGAAMASVVSDVVLLLLLLWNVSKYLVTLSLIRDLRLDRLPLMITALALRGVVNDFVSFAAVLLTLPFVLRASKYLEWRFADGRFSVRQASGR